MGMNQINANIVTILFIENEYHKYSNNEEWDGYYPDDNYFLVRYVLFYIWIPYSGIQYSLTSILFHYAFLMAHPVNTLVLLKYCTRQTDLGVIYILWP